MLLRKRSAFSGNINVMDIPLEYDDYCTRRVRWSAGEHIQIAFDVLTHDQREFIKLGVTPEEWVEYMGSEPED